MKTLVSYVPKPNRSVILVSTEHHRALIDRNSEQKKPEIIAYYNETKGAVDTFDQMVEKFSCRRRSNRWPFTFFMYMLHAAALYSFILFKLKNPNEFLVNDSRTRRLKLESLSCNLIKVGVTERQINLSIKNYSGLHGNIINSMMKVGFKIDRENKPTSSSNEVKKPCYSLECKRSKSRSKSRTGNVCVECGSYACKIHCEITKMVLCKNCILD